MVMMDKYTIAEILGAIGGSLGSLVTIKPKSKKDASFRFFVSVILGVIFGPISILAIGKYLDIGSLDELDQALIGSASVSLFCWVVVGWVHRNYGNVKK